jgi:hypothetical protein
LPSAPEPSYLFLYGLDRNPPARGERCHADYRSVQVSKVACPESLRGPREFQELEARFLIKGDPLAVAFCILVEFVLQVGFYVFDAVAQPIRRRTGSNPRTAGSNKPGGSLSPLLLSSAIIEGAVLCIAANAEGTTWLPEGPRVRIPGRGCTVAQPVEHRAFVSSPLVAAIESGVGSGESEAGLSSLTVPTIRRTMRWKG